MIHFAPDFNPDRYDPSGARHFHRILCTFEDFGSIVDVTFFGNIHHRVLLKRPGPLGQPLGDGKHLYRLGLIMSFEPNREKHKYVLVQHIGEQSPQISEYDEF